MRILITGSEGMIGKHLVLALDGHDVVHLNRKNQNRNAGIEDPLAIREALCGCQGVIHLAAISRACHPQRDLVEKINIEGTRHLVNEILRLENFRPWVVFASSKEVYGRSSSWPTPEDAPLHPVNPYGESKQIGEGILTSAQEKRNLGLSILRISNVYGSLHDKPDRLVYRFSQNSLLGLPLVCQGPSTLFDLIHIHDVITAILSSISLLSQGKSLPPLNICRGQGISLMDVAHKVNTLCGSKSLIQIEPANSFISAFVGDNTRAQALLKWSPRLSFLEGVSTFISEMRKLITQEETKNENSENYSRLSS